MDMRAWDIIIIVFLAVFIVLFATGNGDKVSSLFGSGSGRDPNRDYDRKKTDRASLVLCCVLLVVEILLLVFPHSPVMGYVSITTGIVSLCLYMYYLRKYCRK